MKENIRSEKPKKKEGLSKKERMSKKEMKRVFNQGRRVRSKDYTAIYMKEGFGYGKLGITLQKKIGNAVQRNYERRCMKEIHRKLKQDLEGTNVILMRHGKKTLSFFEKQSQIKRLIKIIQQKAKQR